MSATNTAKQSSSFQTASVRRALANPCERVPRPRPSPTAHSCKGMPRRTSTSTHAQIFSGTADSGPVRAESLDPEPCKIGCLGARNGRSMDECGTQWRLIASGSGGSSCESRLQRDAQRDRQTVSPSSFARERRVCARTGPAASPGRGAERSSESLWVAYCG